MKEFLMSEWKVVFVSVLFGLAAFFYQFNPVKKENTSNVEQQINMLEEDIQSIKKMPSINRLSNNWEHSKALCLYLGVKLQENQKEQLNGGVTAEQKAYFATINGNTKSVLIAAWLMQRYFNAQPQKISLNKEQSALSIAVLGQ